MKFPHDIAPPPPTPPSSSSSSVLFKSSINSTAQHGVSVSFGDWRDTPTPGSSFHPCQLISGLYGLPVMFFKTVLIFILCERTKKKKIKKKNSGREKLVTESREQLAFTFLHSGTRRPLKMLAKNQIRGELPVHKTHTHTAQGSNNNNNITLNTTTKTITKNNKRQLRRQQHTYISPNEQRTSSELSSQQTTPNVHSGSNG